MGCSQSALNFGAGPAKLPREVLLEVQHELLSFKGSGMSLMEMSHRSNEYTKINDDAQKAIRDLLNVPNNYKVLFLQGGASGAFSAVALNLISRTGNADYIVTGTWSGKAAKEASKYGKVNAIFHEMEHNSNQITWNLSPNASYLYYCDNEAVDGIEFNHVPNSADVPLVCDMSSSIMTKQIDVSKFGVIFGGAQKNIGPAGVTVVIIRDDLLGDPLQICPSILDFTQLAKKNSILNTPVTFSVYVMEKVLQWIKKNGGVAEMERRSMEKSKILYQVIDKSKNFYYCPVDESSRSRINVSFKIGGANGNLSLEEKFIEEAEKLYIFQIKGLSAVGGIRVSLYNAVSVEDVKYLVRFMEAFQKKYG